MMETPHTSTRENLQLVQVYERSPFPLDGGSSYFGSQRSSELLPFHVYHGYILSAQSKAICQKIFHLAEIQSESGM